MYRAYASVELTRIAEALRPQHRAVGSLYFVTADFNPLDANDSSTWSAVGTKHLKRSINPISGEKMVNRFHDLLIWMIGKAYTFTMIRTFLWRGAWI